LPVALIWQFRYKWQKTTEGKIRKFVPQTANRYQNQVAGYACLPLNKGNNFQTEMGPSEENCPSDNSRKNRGRPARTRMMTYGIRKLASTHTINQSINQSINQYSFIKACQNASLDQFAKIQYSTLLCYFQSNSTMQY